MKEVELYFNGPSAATTVALAHGAGAGMDSPFMQAFAEGLASAGLRVARFEFPYMAGRRAGKRRPPDREPALRQTWAQVIEQLGPARPFIGGKSLGGRIASLVADEAAVPGLVCLGYPFHPAGQPEKLRVDHLRDLKTPTLILQGERDTLGNRTDVAAYELSKAIEVRWLPDGDHSFKPRVASGRTELQNWQEAIRAAAEFVKRVSETGMA
jgi:uncharacterized protein